MGGGGLRILGHKRWHVWRRDNIERVERDERLHDEQQRQEAVERRQVEQERRVEALTGVSGERPVEHVNLFKREEEQYAVALAKASLPKGKQAKDETLGRHGQLPWYARVGNSEESGAKSERKRQRELEMEDPLKRMRPADDSDDGFKIRDRKASGSDRRRYSARYAASTTSSDSSDDSDSDSSSDSDSNGKHRRRSVAKSRRRHSNQKQPKRHKRHKRHEHSHNDLIAQLRKERLQRERNESRRASELLSKH